MKTRYFILAAIMVLGATSAFGQFNSATANANATANIIAPITLTNTAQLNFGDVVPSGVAGTVTVAPNGVRTNGGGTTLGNGALVTAASFTVGGQGSATYSITLPASTSLTGPGAAMTVNSFTSSPTPTGTLSAGGSQTLTVGATLQVNAGQLAGTYTGNFNVTVAYN